MACQALFSKKVLIRFFVAICLLNYYSKLKHTGNAYSMSKLHFFSIDYWRDWRNPETPAPSADGRSKTLPVQEDWPRYRYDFLVDNTLRSVCSQSRVLIYVEPHYREQVAQFEKEKPLPENAEIITGPVFKHVRDNYSGFDHLYLTRLDSDDLFHENAVEEILAHEPIFRTLIYQVGFIYDVPTRRIDYYAHPCPPFYTDIFSKAEVDTGAKPKRKGHGHGLGGMKELLSPGKFVVMCHNQSMQCTTSYEKLQAVTKRHGHLLQNKPPLLDGLLCEFGSPLAV